MREREQSVLRMRCGGRVLLSPPQARGLVRFAYLEHGEACLQSVLQLAPAIIGEEITNIFSIGSDLWTSREATRPSTAVLKTGRDTRSNLQRLHWRRIIEPNHRGRF